MSASYLRRLCMKKYTVILCIATFLSVLLIVSGTVIKSNIPYVEVFSITPTDVENTIVCTGRVEYCEDTGVYADDVGMISDIFVACNDKIEEGDALFAMKIPTDDLSVYDYADIANGDSSTQKKLKEITVYAKEPGIVKSINYKKNDIVGKNSCIVSFASDRNLQIRVPVSESKISYIKVGQDVKITGSGFRNTVYSGIVSSIADEATQTTTSLGKETTVDVTVSVNEPTNNIKAGYTAKCSIVVSIGNDKLILPYESILTDSDGKEYVYLYKNKRIRKQYIVTGDEYDGGIEIMSGIDTDSLIVSSTGEYSDNCTAVAVWSEVHIDV